MNNVKKLVYSVDSVRIAYKEQNTEIKKLYFFGGNCIENRQMLSTDQRIADALAVGDRDLSVLKEREARLKALLEGANICDALQIDESLYQTQCRMASVHADALKRSGIEHIVIYVRVFDEGEALFNLLTGDPIVDKDGNEILSRGGKHIAVQLPE